MTTCQVCIIQDIVEEATHTCWFCHLDICDNEDNHTLDHARIDEYTQKNHWFLEEPTKY